MLKRQIHVSGAGISAAAATTMKTTTTRRNVMQERRKLREKNRNYSHLLTHARATRQRTAHNDKLNFIRLTLVALSSSFLLAHIVSAASRHVVQVISHDHLHYQRPLSFVPNTFVQARVKMNRIVAVAVSVAISRKLFSFTLRLLRNCLAVCAMQHRMHPNDDEKFCESLTAQR